MCVASRAQEKKKLEKQKQFEAALAEVDEQGAKVRSLRLCLFAWVCSEQSASLPALCAAA